MTASCPRGHGPLLHEDDDLVCFECGHRQVEVSRNGTGSGGGGDYSDPFATIVRAMREALTELQRDLSAGEARVTERRGQMRRMQKALAFLTGSSVATAAPKRHSGTGRCGKCGHGFRSKEHADCRAEPVAA